MRKKRFLIAILMVLLTSLSSTCWADKYVTWVPAFKIDKAWQFDSIFDRNPTGTSADGTVLDHTSFVNFPHQIAWAICVKSKPNLNQQLIYCSVVLFNKSTKNSHALVEMYFDGINNCGPSPILDYNDCVTAQTNSIIWQDGEGYNYFHTQYGDEASNFIAAAGSNLQVKVYYIWYRSNNNSDRHESLSDDLDAADRQQISSNLPQANPTDAHWTVHDNKTCVAFKSGVDQSSGTKLRVREWYFNPIDSVYDSFSSDSFCYYHPYYLNTPVNINNNPNTRYYWVDLIYGFNTNNYYPEYTLPTTTMLYHSYKKLEAPAFAQPENAVAVDNKNGSVTLTWSNRKHNNVNEPYDNSRFIIERATNQEFLTNTETYYKDFVYETGEGNTNYTLTDTFDFRDEGYKHFYYRIYREHAEKTELNCITRAGVFTDCFTLSNFEATIDSTTNKVNLRWNYNGGVRDRDIKLKITYNDTIIERRSSSPETEINGLGNFVPCVPTRITAQLYADNTAYGSPVSTTVTLPFSSSDLGIIDTLTADAGYFTDKVNITWTVNKTHNNFSRFEIVRKIYGDTVETSLANVPCEDGTYNYSYTDNTCIPGVYYLYILKGFIECDNKVSDGYSRNAIGFAQPYGVVSGQIAYSGNQAVKDVTVTALCEGKFSGKSISFVAANHSKLEIPATRVTKMLGNTAGTIEFFVCLNDTATHNPIVECGNRFKLSNQNNKLKLTVGSNHTEVDSTLSIKTFTHIAITYDNQNVTLYVNGVAAGTLPVSQQAMQAIKLGFDNTDYMTGNLDEIRVWNTTRTPEEIKKYMSAYLQGTESGLTAYYRCDDDINITLFDISKTGNNFNGHHLRMNNVTIDRHSTPTSEQLGLKVYTDEYGNYLFNNIPYSTEGTLYTITPKHGIHQFSPAQRPLFFNSNAVTHNAVDFEDISSFPVSGKVTFENTNYPVKGCQFYIDGATLCTEEGETIETDDEGKFTISVPIGKHYITVKKNGHTFADNGRYPATDKHEFQNKETDLTFKDSTFVLLTGRVAGGSDEEEKPHGFGKGKATIGQARITLGTQGDLYNLNTNENEGRTFTMPADSLHGSCNSVATTDRAYQRLAHDITILTDPRTGEFNVMLPPIDFEVKKVELIHNGGNITFDMSSISNPSLGSQDIGSKTTDSLRIDSTSYEYFSYSAKLDVIHYDPQPKMTLQQNDNDMALGAPSLIYKNKNTNFTDTIPLYKTDSLGNIEYKFDYPCFSQDSTYYWKITAFETYVNYDTQDTTRQPFRYGIVSVANDIGTQVEKDRAWTDTTITTSGNEVIHVSGNEMMLDSTGTTCYSFKVGEPNVMQPFTKSFQITYQDRQRTRTYDWEGNNNRNTGIILGRKILGTKFITDGPDEVFYILRAPLGTGSTATWQSGQTITKTCTKIKQYIENWSFQEGAILGYESCLVTAPLGAGVAKKFITNHKVLGAVTNDTTSQWSTSQTWTFTNNETVSTTIPGSKGDTYIGSATNQLFGKSQRIFVTRDTLGEYHIAVVNETALGSKFTTQFNYSQDYVVRTLIPDLQQQRNELLTPVTASEYNTSYVNNTNSEVYITTLAPTDTNFGTDSTYLMILPDSWPNDSTVPDQVCVYNNRITRWMDALRHNERCKVMVHNSSQPFNRRAWEQAVYQTSDEMFYSVTADPLDSTDLAGAYLDKVMSKYKDGWLIKNYSLGAGGNISCSETRRYSSCGGIANSNKFRTGLKGDHTTTMMGIGMEIKWSDLSGTNDIDEFNDDTTRTSTVSYNVSIGRYDALSFDVYQAPDGFGPIFAARGGQTSCPHLKKEMTQFYEPGQHEIQPATTATFAPQLQVRKHIISNVPCGKKAIFNITMANTSNAYGITTFKLRQIGNTNTNGAILKIDGMPLTDEGSLFTFNAYDTIPKTLELTATREDILDYDSIALVLETECWRWDADTVWISAHFMQTCSEVDLRADKTTINNTTGNTVQFTIDGFEQDFRNLKGILLQYQSASNNQWSLLKQFPADSAAVIQYNHTFTKNEYPDGTYRFRAVTLCKSGNEMINNESEEVTIVVDVTAPKKLGLPYPLDGIYTANNQIYVDFNEPIQSGLIFSDNVTVEGVLNAHPVDHYVALSLENNTAMSNATYNLGTSPFTIEMWLNYSKPGTIFSYAGGGSNGIEFAIDANNKFVVTIGGTSYTSTNAMLPDQWFHLAVQCNTASHQLDATYSYDDVNETLFNGQGFTGNPAASGNIRFGGNGINAKVHDIALWKNIQNTAKLLSKRKESKSPYTPDIVSLWYCNEGKGNTVADIARQRNLTLTDDAWAYSHENYAMHVAAGDSAMVNISKCSIASDKSYLFEMWFRASGNAELFHFDNNKITASINNGNLVLNSQTLPIRNYQDNVWHHLAIINPTISTPVIAIDGKQLSSPSLDTLPPFEAGALVIGNANNTNSIDIDEIRLWNINTTLDATRQRMGSCMRGNEDGLVAYYPMEAYGPNTTNNQKTTEFSLADKKDSTGIRVITHSDATHAQSSSVPALLESRSTESVAHTHTASEDRVVVNITEQPQHIEGCWLEITVKNIIDANGNYSEPIRWTVFVNRNQLLWDNNSYTIVKDEVQDTTFNLTIVNNSSVIQQWTIDNIPTCMTLSETTGHIQPLQTKTVTCTIDATAEHGETEHTLYLIGNENMDCPLYITTKVYANKPDWNINPNEFEYSMSIIGYVEVNGAITDDEEDMMAAFVDGTLSGVANLRLLPAMGRYYIMMTIFQNDETTSGPKDITFRYWDASTGIVYSDAMLYSNNGNAINNLKYQTNTVLGSINDPIRIVMGDKIEQVLELNTRWNWVSFNVEPAQKSINSIMSPYIDYFSIIKSQNGYAQPDRILGTVNGNIGNMDCKTGYKIKAKMPFDIHLNGFAASLDSVINFKAQQWTWFGFLPQKAMTVNAAMSNINPTVSDIVKSKSQFATWDGYQWIGSLEVMRPGQGYVYRSYSSDNISFTYPDYAGMANLMPAERKEDLNYFDPVDPGMYQGNMNVTAVVHYNGEEVTTAEIGVFAGSECRAAATYHNGFYFITVPGDSAVNLTVKVVYNDSVYTLQGNMTYNNDAIIGSVVAPLTIELTTGIVPDSPTDNDGEPLTVVSVEAVKDAKVEKVLIDNEVFIIRDGKMYDVLGRPRK